MGGKLCSLSDGMDAACHNGCEPSNELPMNPTLDTALARLAEWKAALAELGALEQQLGAAMLDYAHTLDEPPRSLIIEAERKRAETQRLFDLAIAALDANSIARTGHTNFGELR